MPMVQIVPHFSLMAPRYAAAAVAAA